jgi:hypothetical protein
VPQAIPPVIPPPQVAAAPPLQLPRIDRIQVETDATVSQELMRNMISQRTGTELDEKALKRDIADLYGLDEFSRVDYRIDRDDAGATTLVIRGTAHPGGANYLKLGLSWDQDNRGTSEFGLRGSWRARGLNSLGGEWYTKAQVGGDSEIATQFYQPLDKGRRFFLDTRYSYSQRQLNLSDDGEIRGRQVALHVDGVLGAGGVGEGGNVGREPAVFRQHLAAGDDQFDGQRHEVRGDDHVGAAAGRDGAQFTLEAEMLRRVERRHLDGGDGLEPLGNGMADNTVHVTVIHQRAGM